MRLVRRRRRRLGRPVRHQPQGRNSSLPQQPRRHLHRHRQGRRRRAAGPALPRLLLRRRRRRRPRRPVRHQLPVAGRAPCSRTWATASSATITATAGLGRKASCVGCVFADVFNRGRLDLYVTTDSWLSGANYTEPQLLKMKHTVEPNMLYVERRQGQVLSRSIRRALTLEDAGARRHLRGPRPRRPARHLRRRRCGERQQVGDQQGRQSALDAHRPRRQDLAKSRASQGVGHQARGQLRLRAGRRFRQRRRPRPAAGQLLLQRRALPQRHQRQELAARQGRRHQEQPRRHRRQDQRLCERTSSSAIGRSSPERAIAAARRWRPTSAWAKRRRRTAWRWSTAARRRTWCGRM